LALLQEARLEKSYLPVATQILATAAALRSSLASHDLVMVAQFSLLLAPVHLPKVGLLAWRQARPNPLKYHRE